MFKLTNPISSKNYLFTCCLIIINFQLNCVAQSASMGTEFCTTTTTACNTVSGCVDHTINVSGIGVLSITNVLNAIYVSMGSPSCQGNLTSYDFTIIAPDGTVFQFIDNITSSSTTGWVNTTFIDNPNVERIRNDFSSGDQALFNPWSIGYYRPNFGSGFSSLNGINADGNWIFRVCEGASGNMISFNSACLSFGTPVETVDAIGLNHDDCLTALCINNTSLVNADNDGASVDPLYPGDVIDGCNWNSGNHESAWFKFQPTGTTATITLSGLDGPSGLGYQAIILENDLGNGCPPSALNWSVPTGGCPDDEAINNTAYLSSNGGGTSTPGNVYQNDINFNMEFNLSGLTPNKVYYLYVDGNTTTVDETFVVELSTPGAGDGPNGTASCSTPLPVDFINFNATLEENKVLLEWSTAFERNNMKFVVEKSNDYFNWDQIIEINGAGNSTVERHYYTYDYNPNNGINYYRIKQVDFDGKFSYSYIKTINIEGEIIIEPNPNNGQFTLYGLEKNKDSEIVIYNLYGQKVFEIITNNVYEEININDLSKGVYYLIINKTKKLKFIKQ